MSRMKLASVALMLVCLIAATTVRAVEEGGNIAQQAVGVAFKWAHFVIVVVVLIYVVRIYGRPHFRRRADAISLAISKAAKLRAEAEHELKQAAAKIASLEQEVAQFRETAQREARLEYERLRAMMQKDAERVGAAAKVEIEAVERSARVELKKLTAGLAVDRAESLVTKQMTPAVQEAMIHNFVASLQGRPN